MLAIKNCCIVARDHLIPDGVILINDGILESACEARFTEIPEGSEVVDAGGLFAGPGLIDEHSHASDAHLYIEEPEAAAQK
jgi:imidazolonepropionase-like amidohydrolase